MLLAEQDVLPAPVQRFWSLLLALFKDLENGCTQKHTGLLGAFASLIGFFLFGRHAEAGTGWEYERPKLRAMSETVLEKVCMLFLALLFPISSFLHSFWDIDGYRKRVYLIFGLSSPTPRHAEAGWEVCFTGFMVILKSLGTERERHGEIGA